MAWIAFAWFQHLTSEIESWTYFGVDLNLVRKYSWLFFLKRWSILLQINTVCPKIKKRSFVSFHGATGFETGILQNVSGNVTASCWKRRGVGKRVRKALSL